MRLRPLGAVAAMAAILTLGSTTAIAAPATGPTLDPSGAVMPTPKAKVIKSGLRYPWDLAFTPDGRMLVTIRGGQVLVFANGNGNPALLSTKKIAKTWAVGEAGVMGIAVDNDFASNQLVYVCATRQYQGKIWNQLLAYRLTAENKLVHSHKPIALGMRGGSTHNGCAVEMGPDDKLWVSMGEANQPRRAQNPKALNGKILRLNRDGSVPSDNPIMPGATQRTIVYSMGHRNPQGIAFEAGTGRVYASEHGPERDDEINWIRPGENYGWPCYTGNNRPYQTTGCDAPSSYQTPAWQSGGSTIATSGSTFLNHTRWGAWQGQFFVSTLKQSDLRRFEFTGADKAVARQTLFNNRWGRIRAAVEGPSGRLYLTTSNGTNDRIIRITATAT